MTGTLDAWERIKLYAYQHAHPLDLEQIREDVDTMEGVVGGRPVTAPLARTPVRDELLHILSELDVTAYRHGKTAALPGPNLTNYADRILALVQPDAGVTLSPMEARLFAALLRDNVAMMERNDLMGREADYIEERRALAARLEAVSDTRTGGVA